MAEKYIYDITEVNGALVATDQKGVIRKQLQNIVDIYTYKENVTLGTPENIKLVEKYGDYLELDALNTKSVAGVPINGSFATLLTEVNNLIDTLNAITVTAALDPNAATLAEQLTQTVELNSINTELYLQTIEAEQTNEYLRKKGITPTVTPFIDFSNAQVGGPISYPLNVTDFWFTLQPINVNRPAVGTVNNIDELILLWNSTMPENILIRRSASTAWLFAGSEPVPSLVGDGYTINGGGFRLYGATSFGSDSYPVPEALTSNLDCILSEIVKTNATLTASLELKNDIFQKETTNPAALIYTDFKKLSFVADGAITVTVDGNAVVYPQSFSWGAVGGTTFKADTASTKTVTFNGTGKIIVTIQK